MTSAMLLIFSLGVGFGIAGIFQIPFTSIGPLAVFVIAGVGVDDIIIIVNCFDQQSKALSMEERMGRTLEKAAPAIFLTSLTSCLAFLVSCFVDMPAVQFFCATAGCAVLAVFLCLSLVFFAPCLVLDARRMERGDPDLLGYCNCCLPEPPAAGGDTQAQVEEKGRVRRQPLLRRPRARSRCCASATLRPTQPRRPRARVSCRGCSVHAAALNSNVNANGNGDAEGPCRSSSA